MKVKFLNGGESVKASKIEEVNSVRTSCTEKYAEARKQEALNHLSASRTTPYPSNCWGRRFKGFTEHSDWI